MRRKGGAHVTGSERTLRQLVEQAPNAMVMVDGGGTVLVANRHALEWFRYSADELIGSPVDLLMPERFRMGHQHQLRAYLRVPVARPMGTGRNLFGRRKDGSEFPVDISLSPFETPAGLRVLASMLDLTEPKRVEAALRESEARYRMLFEQAADGIFISDGEGNYLDVNPAGCVLLGYARQEIIGRNLQSVIDPEELRRDPPRLAELRSGEALVRQRTLVRKDGTRLAAELSVRQLPDGRMQAIVRDLTERMRAEAALKESEERFSKAFRSNHVAMAICRLRDDMLIDANTSFLQALGVSREEVVGRSVASLRAAMMPGSRSEVLERAERGEPVAGMEVEIRGRSGGVAHLLMSIDYITLGGERCALASFTDITARKLAEEELRKSEQRLAESQRIASLGSWELDLATREEWWSDEQYRLNGIPKGTPPRHDVFLSLIPPADRASFNERYDKVLAEGTWEGDYRIVRPDGQVRHMHCFVQTRYDGNGRPIAMAGTNQDITERVRTEQELERQRRLLQAVMDTVPFWLYIKDDQARYLLVNRDMAEFFGQPKEAFVGRRHRDFFRSEESDVADRVDAEVIRAGKPVENFDARAARRDGSISRRRVLKLPWFREDGTVAGLVGSSIDITPQRLAEEELVRQQRLFEAVMDTVPIWLYIKDDQARYLMVNREMAEFFGQPKEFFVGKGTRDMLGPELGALAERIDTEIVRTGRPVKDFDVQITRADGTTFRRRVFRLPWLREDGTVAGIVGSSIDITARVLAQQELERQRELLRTVIDSIPHRIVVRDLNGAYLLANEAIRKLWPGIPQAAMPEGGPPHLGAEERSASERRRRMVIAEGRSREHELHRLRSDGIEEWVQARWVPLRDAQQKVIGTVSVTVDITERKKAEEELRYSEERFLGILSLAPDAIISIDEAQRIVLFNRGAEQIFGFAAEEIQGKPLDVLIPERYRAAHRQHVAGFQGDQRDHRYMSGRQTIVGLRRNGEEFPAEASISHFLSQRGRISTVILRDVSARIQAQQALARSEARLRQALEIARLGTFEWNLATMQVQLSGETCRILGVPQHDEAGFSGAAAVLTARIHPDDVPRFRQATEAAIGAGEPFKTEYRVVRTSVDTRIVQAQGEVIRDEQGRPLRLVGIVHDVTDRVELEHQLRQAQKMEAVGTLAGGIAHDFNNMLQVILGNAELAGYHLAQTEVATRHLRRLVEAGQRAAGLTRQLLAFSRQQVPRRSVFSLGDLARNLVNMARRLLGERVEITVRVAASNPRVNADAGMIEQVLLNLCVNARDAMPEGGCLIIDVELVAADDEFCRANAWAKPGPYARIAVSDTGHGMTPDIQQRIFEPFFSTKEVGRGTGLGLSVAYGVVEQHGGMITVRSAPGQGSTFLVYLPATGDEVADGAAPGLADVRGGSETILLAEDEDSVRTFTSETLQGQGYRVIEARDGEQAVEAFREAQGEIAMAILDLVMPKRTGREVFAALRALAPHLPMLFSTGYASDSEEDAIARKLGVPVLRKPFSVTELLAAVRRVLDSH
ncbi:MAG: PAS domain S-box protein [Candidatus Lambdaproteobacteria bacterium]|nr:PAS domain S-box protein [Candidatus Lambdaproteobacteria bacterium]